MRKHSAGTNKLQPDIGRVPTDEVDGLMLYDLDPLLRSCVPR
jgi:hypothetical protein